MLHYTAWSRLLDLSGLQGTEIEKGRVVLILKSMIFCVGNTDFRKCDVTPKIASKLRMKITLLDPVLNTKIGCRGTQLPQGPTQDRNEGNIPKRVRHNFCIHNVDRAYV